jgi:hypothetical protein
MTDNNNFLLTHALPSLQLSPADSKMMTDNFLLNARATFLAAVAGRCFDGSVAHTWTDGNSPGALGWRVCPGRQVRQTLFSGAAIDVDAGSTPDGWTARATESFSGGSDASCPQDGRRRSSRVTYACAKEGGLPTLTRSYETPVCSYEITLALGEWCAVDEAARGGSDASAGLSGAGERALTTAMAPAHTPPASAPNVGVPESRVHLPAPPTHEPGQDPFSEPAQEIRAHARHNPAPAQFMTEPALAAASSPEMTRVVPETTEVSAPLHSLQLAKVQLKALRHESRGEADAAAAADSLGPAPRSSGALNVAVASATAASAVVVLALGVVKRHGLSGVR